MYLPAPNESSFSPCPAGTFTAICYRVIDLGTQRTNYNGEEKTAHKVLLSWELVDEKMDDGRPFTISASYTWSMHEKSSLRKILESWRGATFKDSDFGPGGFDIRNVIGKPCTLNIVQSSKNGSVYSNVSSVGKPLKGIEVSEPVNSTIYLWLVKDRWRTDAFSQLSGNLQSKIMSSPEYIEMMNDIDRAAGAHPHQHNDASDEIPF